MASRSETFLVYDDELVARCSAHLPMAASSDRSRTCRRPAAGAAVSPVGKPSKWLLTSG